MLSDLESSLPWNDQLTGRRSWREFRASEAYQQRCLEAHAAFEAAAEAGAVENGAGNSPGEWEWQVAMGRCLRKAGRPPAEWLPKLARACQTAAHVEGGLVAPVYALHAARMRLLLKQPAGQERQEEEEKQELALLARYAFLPETQHALQGASLEHARHRQLLLDDCVAAMQWVLERDRHFHHASYRWVHAGASCPCCTRLDGSMARRSTSQTRFHPCALLSAGWLLLRAKRRAPLLRWSTWPPCSPGRARHSQSPWCKFR